MSAVDDYNNESILNVVGLIPADVDTILTGLTKDKITMIALAWRAYVESIATRDHGARIALMRFIAQLEGWVV